MAGQPLRILQITDLHLRADPDGELYGVRTGATFRAVLERALGSPEWRPAAVLVTGDIAEDATAAVYERFVRLIEPYGLPVLCLPGNHDEPALMRGALQRNGVSFCESRSIHGWRVVPLDSFLPDEPGGALSAGELTRLERELVAAAGADEWVLVAVHHQPVPIGSAWLDGFGLANGAPMLELLARHPRARALVWGHVHQAWEGRHAQLRLLATPSTCAQFTPHTSRCVMDTRPPAYRRLELGAGGDVRTEVCWLEDLTLTERPPDTRAGT
jgi:Icc protein